MSLTNRTISLDLDQCLVATQDHMSSLFESGIMTNPELLPLRNRTYIIEIDDIAGAGSGTTQKCWGVMRPHLPQFLDFCYKYFERVIVFSAGKKGYVEAIVDAIFKDLPYPDLVFSYDEIHSYYDKDGNKITVKPLTKVMKHIKGMTLKNSLALDDLLSNFEQNPDNGVLIPPYSPEYGLGDGNRHLTAEEVETLVDNLNNDEDDALLRFQKWLLEPEVMNCDDVRKLDKDYIFDEIEAEE